MAFNTPHYSTTIWHPDVLHIICSYLDTPSIKALRLVRSDINETATPYLFRTLVLSFSKRRFQCLNRVSETPKFSKGVRTILWDTAPYYLPNEPYDESMFLRSERDFFHLQLNFSTDGQKVKQQMKHVLSRYRTLAKEEKLLFDSDHEPFLTSAFKRLKKLRSLELVAWMHPLSEEGKLYSG